VNTHKPQFVLPGTDSLIHLSRAQWARVGLSEVNPTNNECWFRRFTP